MRNPRPQPQPQALISFTVSCGDAVYLTPQPVAFPLGHGDTPQGLAQDCGEEQGRGTGQTLGSKEADTPGT